MKQFLTSHDIANGIRMMRPLFGGAVVIVEGDSDARVYKRFVVESCRVLPAHGKSNALGAIMQLEETGTAGVLAILDSDFWRLDGIDPPADNIVTTDTHDLETMIVASRSLDMVMDEFGAERKVKRLDGDIRGMLVNTALPIGFLRWISSSHRENLSLGFKDISLSVIVECGENSMKTNIDTLIREVRRHTRHASFDTREIKAKITRLTQSRSHDPWQVCRGHDLVHILTIGLRNVFGNRHARSISYDQVDRILRISFGHSEFSQTRLFASIELWEKAHPAFPVLQK